MHSALLRFLVLLRFFFRRLLFFRLVRFGPRVLLLLCAWFGRRGPTLRLRTLALRRSHRPLSWLIPVGLWPIIRLGLSLRNEPAQRPMTPPQGERSQPERGAPPSEPRAQQQQHARPEPNKAEEKKSPEEKPKQNEKPQ